MSDADAARLLDEREASALTFDDDRISWNGFTVNASHVRQVREQVAVAFGSCSFREPVDELRLVTTV
jgi:hypothetical protein